MESKKSINQILIIFWGVLIEMGIKLGNDCVNYAFDDKYGFIINLWKKYWIIVFNSF